MPLEETLIRLIRTTGPISVARYIHEGNAHYYASKDPLGREGDFVTAPEISQIFGELIGLWCADIWSRAGSPDTIAVVELGPGRGTLMSDLLRAGQRLGFPPEVHLVEASPALRKVQREALPNATWHDDVSTLPEDRPLIFIANEFFDALPTRQLVRTEAGWRERMIGLSDNRLAFVAGGKPMDAAVPLYADGWPVGAILETSPAASAIVDEIVHRLRNQGGAALLIDYGYDEPQAGSTLQAVKAHCKVDPLGHPGSADLTTLVDFSVLADVARRGGARCLGPVEQGTWLRAMGIDFRAERLAERNPEQAADIRAGVARLTEHEAMGSLFKVLGLASPDWPEGAGF